MEQENLILAYMAEQNIGVCEFATRLGISKGSASELASGKRRVGQKTARRLEGLTGRPWHEFMSPL
jgi:transcriptional regulator with XRE-family HTH domain